MQTMEKEAIHLKESKEGYLGMFCGKKGKVGKDVITL